MIKNSILRYRRFIVVTIHFFLIVLSYIISFYIRFEFSINFVHKSAILKTLPLLILVKLLLFYFFGLFSGLWRYVGIRDIWKILLANITSSFLFFLAVIFYHGLIGYPRSVVIIDFFLCMALTSGVRFFTRLIRETSKIDLSQKKRKAIIIGAGDAGVLTLKECQGNPTMDLEVVGFIDDDTSKKGNSIYGIKVFGGRKRIPYVVSDLNVEEIILAIPSVKGDTIRDILSYCEQTNAKIKIIPGLDKILSGHMEVRPRAVKPDDLLGRETVRIDENEINSYIRNKRILVTGAGGSIGSELCRQIARFSPKHVTFLDNHENYVYFLGVEFSSKFKDIKYNTVIGDIKDINTLRHVFTRYKPQVVFHAAAHKHVPLMEENPASAVKINVIGTRNLIYASNHYGVEKFVLISTDKAVNPTSIMGATKRIAEKILQAKSKVSKTKFMAVRFGNVLGSSGSVIPLFKKQIEEGGPVTVTHPDVKRYFMSIPEASILVLQAGAIGIGGEIFILDMGEQIKIVDIARNIIALSGLKLGKEIEIKYIGLRPGEKLYEEILLNKEEDKVTKHDKIYVASPGDYNPSKIRQQIRQLEQFANNNDNEKILQKIKEMVPTYTPQMKS
ncbi:MAG: nucleoside-diphosphate sugar epimerase/dehydratase [Elusimicrobia bacterium]|nr:nucleoside-diphosphate sugar epimerase/dehydratase [Elusimicrobiota bacterium]